MFDTVGIKHFFRTLPCEDFKDKWRFTKKGKRFATWICNYKGKETLPNLTIYQTPEGIYHFEALVCLPKMLFGHNARLPEQDEVDFGLKMIADYAEKMSGLPFKAETAGVYLIHYAYDSALTEAKVWEMVEKLSKRRFVAWRKRIEEDATIYFNRFSKTRRIRIYPKLQQVLADGNATTEAIHFANGKLRFEDCYLKKPSIDSLVERLGLPDNSAQNLLTEGVSNVVMSELLEMMNYYDLLNNEKSDLERLREVYKSKKASNLRGFLQMLKECGADFWRDERHGYTKDCYDRLLRECRRANLP